MTTPPQKLRNILIPGVVLRLCSPSGQSLGTIEYTVAVRMAVAGEIEGVCASSGRVRFLRKLTAEAQSALVETGEISAQSKRGGSPLNAVTNLGAYRQHLTNGVVWALCRCRHIDGARA